MPMGLCSMGKMRCATHGVCPPSNLCGETPKGSSEQGVSTYSTQEVSGGGKSMLLHTSL